MAIVGVIVILIATAVAAFSSRSDYGMMAASIDGAILGLALVIASRR